MFTSIDKALLDRAIRRTLDQAVQHKGASTINGAWPNGKEGQAAKRAYERLASDASDLKALMGRMVNEVGDDSVAKHKRKVVPLNPEVPAGAAPGPEQVGDVVDQQLHTAVAEQSLPSAEPAPAWKNDAAAIGAELAAGPDGPTLDAAAELVASASAELAFNGDGLTPKSLVGTDKEPF